MRVLSAEGRLSATILCVLPFVAAFLLYLLNPKFMETLWTDPLGVKLAIGAAILMVIGIFWSRYDHPDPRLGSASREGSMSPQVDLSHHRLRRRTGHRAGDRLFRRIPTSTRERLRQLAGEPLPAGGRPGGWIENMVKLSGPLARLSVPDEGWDNAPLRIRFMNAGFRQPAAPVVYFAAKTVLAHRPARARLSLRDVDRSEAAARRRCCSRCSLIAAIGYYLPNAGAGADDQRTGNARSSRTCRTPST